MPKIIDYYLIVAYTENDLIEAVKGAMLKGWQPFGAVSVSLSESDEYRYIIFVQAMVLYYITQENYHNH